MNRFLKIGIRSSQHASLFRRASRFPANQERLLAAAMFSSFTNGPPHPSQSHPNINNNQQHAQSQAPPSLELPANVERDLREQKQQQQQQQQQQPNSSSSQNTPFQSQLPFTNITFSSATAKVIFDESSHIPTVLVAFATWDEASVKHLQTVMAIANEKYPQRLRVCGLDVDKEAQLIQAMQITSVPATLAIFAGKAVDSFVGVKSPEELAKFLKPLMKNSPTDASKSLQQELTAAFSMFSQADASPDAIESTLKATLDKCSDSDEDERLTAVAGLLRVAILRDDINAASEFHTYLSDALKPATKTKTPKKKQLPNSSAINAQSTIDPRIQGAMSLFEIFELSKSDKDNLKKSAQLFLENEIELAIDSVLNEIRSKKLPELRELVLKMLNVLKSDGDAASVEKAKKYNARLSNYWFS